MHRLLNLGTGLSRDYSKVVDQRSLVFGTDIQTSSAQEELVSTSVANTRDRQQNVRDSRAERL
jgi:hypothetical protein